MTKDGTIAEAIQLLSKEDNKVTIGSIVAVPEGSATCVANLKDNSLSFRLVETEKAKGAFLRSNGTHVNGKSYKNFTVSCTLEQLQTLSTNPLKQYVAEFKKYTDSNKIERIGGKMDTILN